MEIGIGILIGIGLAIIGRKGARPAIKGTIKAGILAQEAMEDAFHEGKEVISDLVAEAKQESAAYRRGRGFGDRGGAAEGPGQ